MTQRKFTGKIRTDPWESLAVGPPEVMVALWEEFLQEKLRAGKKSGRFRVIRRRIEDAAGFPRAVQGWREMPPEERGRFWRGLMESCAQVLEETREVCVRCGECCEKSSPTLLLEDLPLLRQEVLGWEEIITLPRGEQGLSREEKPTFLAEERLKIREIPGTRQCWFYLAATRSCRIYEHRPAQCRRQQCWQEPPPPASEDFLNRSHLFAGVPEVWELITAHEERCHREKVRRAVAALQQGDETAAESLFEALHFDHYLREMLTREWGLSPAATELLLGRPLTTFLSGLGIRATLTPEGVFRLEPKESRCQADIVL
ncbi:MAG: YkgJ family cysteine cluster protein [Desulfobaccales bacterium]